MELNCFVFKLINVHLTELSRTRRERDCFAFTIFGGVSGGGFALKVNFFLWDLKINLICLSFMQFVSLLFRLTFKTFPITVNYFIVAILLHSAFFAIFSCCVVSL